MNDDTKKKENKFEYLRLSTEYDEGKPETYNGITVTTEDKTIFHCNSGDEDYDLEAAEQFAEKWGKYWGSCSSIEQYVSDINEYFREKEEEKIGYFADLVKNA